MDEQSWTLRLPRGPAVAPAVAIARRVAIAVGAGGRQLGPRHGREGRLQRQLRRQRVDRRRALLHDRHALDDRLRRHHPGHHVGPAHQRVARHADAVPVRPGPRRHHHPGAHRTFPRPVQGRPLEVSRAGPRRRLRLRHQGAQRGARAASSATSRRTRSSWSRPTRRRSRQAASDGLVTVHGSSTSDAVLREAEVGKARAVIVAVSRDDTAVLTTLTVRQLAPDVTVVAAVREAENADLLTQSGADSVITSSDAAGRLLGLATDSPRTVAVVEDLIAVGTRARPARARGHRRRGGSRPAVDGGSGPRRRTRRRDPALRPPGVHGAPGRRPAGLRRSNGGTPGAVPPHQ